MSYPLDVFRKGKLPKDIKQLFKIDKRIKTQKPALGRIQTKQSHNRRRIHIKERMNPYGNYTATQDDKY